MAVHVRGKPDSQSCKVLESSLCSAPPAGRQCAVELICGCAQYLQLWIAAGQLR